MFSMALDAPTQTNVRAHQCGTTIILVVNLMLVLGSVSLLVTPHWAESTTTITTDTDSTTVHCMSSGPYERCYTQACLDYLSITTAKRSIDFFDLHCVKINYHDVESTNSRMGHILHSVEFFVGIGIGLQLAAGICYLIDLVRDYVILKFIAGIFTLISGFGMLISVALFMLFAVSFFEAIPGVDPVPALSTHLGTMSDIGIGLGLANIALGVFNIVRGRRIFRKKSAHNKLYAFGAEMF